MRYLLLVSHGTFAPGLHSVLDMLGGGSAQVLHANLADGMGADEYTAAVEKVLAPLAAEDELVVLGDVVGGSPLTNALKVISDKGLLAHTIAFGGANLPMALTALLQLGAPSLEGLASLLLSEAQQNIKQIELAPADAGEDDEDDI